MILEIKEPHVINNSKGYGRMASPVTHTWRWRQVAMSTNRKSLGTFAEMMSLERFYRRKREYRIVDNIRIYRRMQDDPGN